MSELGIGEAVRLVIWDLDGVYWGGTLAEGGMSYRYENHDLVVALAKRGIVSSLCSNNEFYTVKSLLDARGIWDYFVFPSIDWAPKGQRVAKIITAMQLRAESVLFIDDEPANLAEAVHYAPGLQTAGPAVVAGLLADPRCAGAPDLAMERLEHYRLLARRAVAATGATDNIDFLRESRIRVTIDHDVAASLDRAIELTNRSNQLNYTKNRLPEDLAAARVKLTARLSAFGGFAGLISVTDRYGDYGVVGFVNVHGRYAQSRLVDFCFSCRVLNMGIERFLYRWLGQPELAVKGEVATDVHGAGEIDWISFSDGAGAEMAPRAEKLIDRLVIRGGCDLAAMAHYLAPLAAVYEAELNTARDGRQFRTDNAMLLNVALSDQVPDVALTELGYVAADWRSALARPPQAGERTVWVLSFWTDAFVNLYQHKTLDLALPFLVEGHPHVEYDITLLPEQHMRGVLTSEPNWRAYETLKRDYRGVGPMTRDRLEAALAKLLAAAGEAFIMILLPPESWRDAAGGLHQRPLEARMNRWTRAAVAQASNVQLVDFSAFVGADETCESLYHYDRLVYARAAGHLVELITARFRPEVLQNSGS